MAKIVIELQHEALKSNFDIMNLLRKAYLVARKLKLQEFEDWINNELNGYKDLEKIPDYRLLRGEIKAWNPYRGWIPVILQNDNEKITTHLASDSLANLLNVYENSENKSAVLRFNPTMNNLLSKCSDFNTKYALIIGTNQIYDIIERVRNIILDWSITLEENGIYGTYCDYFVSSDDRLRKRISAIYYYLKVPTKVITFNEFLNIADKPKRTL